MAFHKVLNWFLVCVLEYAVIVKKHIICHIFYSCY